MGGVAMKRAIAILDALAARIGRLAALLEACEAVAEPALCSCGRAPWLPVAACGHCGKARRSPRARTERPS